MTGTKNTGSKDLQVMSNILKEFCITDYDRGVENHMLDFTNRYITTLIEDALLYSTHAKKPCIDSDDVKLAIELQQDKIYTCPPAREITANMARQRNTIPLSTIRSSAGLRLPPDRHSLIACNYHLKFATKKQRNVHTISRLPGPNMAPSTPITPRPNFNLQKNVQTPLIKFSEANKGSTPATALSPMSTTTISSANSSINSQILMPVGILNEVKLSNDVNANKRSHEEEDDYDN